MWSLFRSGFTSATSNHSSDLYDRSPSHLTPFESEPVQKNQLKSLSIETEQSPSSSSLDKSSNSSKATLQIQSLETEHKRPEAPNFNVYSKRKRSIIPAHPPISETLTGNGNVNPSFHTSSALDLPTTLTKGIRPCTQHLISNFVSSQRLSSRFFFLIGNDTEIY